MKCNKKKWFSEHHSDLLFLNNENKFIFQKINIKSCEFLYLLSVVLPTSRFCCQIYCLHLGLLLRVAYILIYCLKSCLHLGLLFKVLPTSWFTIKGCLHLGFLLRVAYILIYCLKCCLHLGLLFKVLPPSWFIV